MKELQPALKTVTEMAELGAYIITYKIASLGFVVLPKKTKMTDCGTINFFDLSIYEAGLPKSLLIDGHSLSN